MSNLTGAQAHRMLSTPHPRLCMYAHATMHENSRGKKWHAEINFNGTEYGVHLNDTFKPTPSLYILVQLPSAPMKCGASFFPQKPIRKQDNTRKLSASTYSVPIPSTQPARNRPQFRRQSPAVAVVEKPPPPTLVVLNEPLALLFAFLPSPLAGSDRFRYGLRLRLR